MEDKIKASLGLIKEALNKAKFPIAMSSFGKDSMVMLDLIKRAGFRLPILFHREPFFPEKFAFANRIIEENGYTVYDFSPMKVRAMQKDGWFEILNLFQMKGSFYVIPVGVDSPIGNESFLCGLKDLYLRPTGTFNFVWDCVFIGHKDSDSFEKFGSVSLKSNVCEREGLPTYYFPLKDFTDEDIWEYHKLFNIPINTSRYNAKEGLKDFEDKTMNPDHFPTCFNCMSKNGGPLVFCPKLGREIESIKEIINFVDGIRLDYTERNVI